MVLTSAGALVASLLGMRRRGSSSNTGTPLPPASPPPPPPPPPSTSTPSSTPSIPDPGVVEHQPVPAATSSSSIRLVVLVFWVGVVVGVVVSGLAAFRLYTAGMAVREEQMAAELQQQEERMEQEKQDRFWLGLAMASVLSVVAVVQSYRMKMAEREACAKNQRRLKSLLVERMSRREAPPPPEEPSGGLQCVVCLAAGREVILLDCGHVCACRLCADTLLREEHPCPVCRADIRTVKPAFIS